MNEYGPDTTRHRMNGNGIGNWDMDMDRDMAWFGLAREALWVVFHIYILVLVHSFFSLSLSLFLSPFLSLQNDRAIQDREQYANNDK